MHIRKRIVLVLLFFFKLSILFSQTWLGMDTGLSCPTQAGSIVYDIYYDTQFEKLYASGAMQWDGNCDTLIGPCVWEDNHWRQLAYWQGYPYFYSIINYQGSLYTGGNVSDPIVNGVLRKLVGDEWVEIPNSSDAITVTQFKIHDDYLYATSGFNYCNGDSANLIFRYDGQYVEPLVHFIEPALLGLCLEFYHDTLYIGGKYYDHNRQINHFASVFGGDIHQVGQGIGVDAIVEDMVVYDDKLWLAGGFGPGTIGNEEQVYLAYYDGHEIHPAPVQTDGRIVALEVYENELYLAGWFSQFNHLESHCVAKMNQFGCYALNPDTVYDRYGQAASRAGNIVCDIEIMHDTLYMGGAFGSIGSCQGLNAIAKLNKSLTGAASYLGNDVQVYPNPTQDNIILETASYFNQSAPISIYDVSGRLILEDYWPLGQKQKSISLSNLSTGIYVLRIVSNNEVISKSVVKR